MPFAGDTMQTQTLKKKQRRRRDEYARKNVVSLRIPDQEKKILEKISEASSKNVSEVVREALELWLDNRRTAVFDLERNATATYNQTRCTTQGVTL